MHDAQLNGFYDELNKLAKADVSQLLSGLAKRHGVNPANVPGIRQAGNIAGADRGRAAQIAGSVRSFLKSPAAQAAPKSVPRSAPGLASVGLGA